MVASAYVLAAGRGRDRVIAVQVHFSEGTRRDYLLHVKAAFDNGRGSGPGYWRCRGMTQEDALALASSIKPAIILLHLHREGGLGVDAVSPLLLAAGGDVRLLVLTDITDADLVPAPAGVRAQAVAHDGALVDDFLLVDGDGALHVTNAPSPAATASLEIARVVVDRVQARLGEWRPGS